VREFDPFPRVIDFAEALVAVKDRMRRTSWGCWRYVAGNLTLEARDERGYFYDVDLDRCRTSAEVCDWIFQVAGKTWATKTILADLIHALDDLLSPQANLCPSGTNKQINPQEILAGRPGYREEEPCD
jgi:hypothetical protein